MMKKWLIILTGCLWLFAGIVYAEEADVLNVVTDTRSDLVIVYDSTDRLLKLRVQNFVEQIAEKYSVNIKYKNVARVTEPYEHELVLGNVRPCAQRAVDLVNGNDDFAVCVQDGHLVCYANSDEGWQYLFDFLCHDLYSDAIGGNLSIPSNYCFIRSKSELAEVSYKEYYQATHHTYSSYVDQFAARVLSKQDQEDQRLAEETAALLGEGFAVYPGSSSALYQGRIVKLDTQDYSKVTRLQNGHVLIAAEFAQTYFGKNVEVQSDGYVDLSALCETQPGVTLLADEATGVYVVAASDASAFEAAHYQRMQAFFSSKYVPEPECNVEQSRTVIVESAPQDVENCLDWKKASYDSFYDPSILAVEENGQTVLYAMYSYKPFVDGIQTAQGSILLISRDRGATWTQVGEYSHFQMTASSTIVEIDGLIYILGGFSQAQIVQYDPSTGNSKFTVLPFDVGFSGPGTPLIHNGRLYKPYGACVLSVSTDSDIMDSANWTVSEPVGELFNEKWLQQSGLIGHGWALNGGYVDWEEGNIVPGKDGMLYVIYRQNITRGCALILALSEDGKHLSYVDAVNGTTLSRTSIIDLPAAKSRHTIRYDERTGRYLCMMNIYTGDAKTQYAWPDMQQRSVLAFTTSDDLVNWEVADVMLVDREMMNPVLSVFAHGFQYVDFATSGENLYFIVRENSGSKTFNYHHEANYITLYTVNDYASLFAEQ